VRLSDGMRVDVAQWEKATAEVLRKLRRLGDDDPDSAAWTALAHQTLDGLTIPPLGTPDVSAEVPSPGVVGAAPYTRGSHADGGFDGTGAWDIRGWFTDPDVDRTAADVITDLENGVNSLWITVGAAGIPASALAKVLEPVFLDLAPVVLSTEGGPDEQLAAARAFADVLADKAVTPHRASSLGVTDLALVADAIAIATTAGVRAFTVDATTVHDSGASNVQELAYSLKAGADYLRAAAAAGIDLAEAADLVDFRYAATDEQFPTIAKLRAARRLWNRVLELSEVAVDRGQSQHAVTSRPMMSKYDPYVNMLRTMVAAFAAGVGGAEAVTVLPFDEPLGLPVAFSRRIARNISSLLVAESHVAAVADPGGGSHLIEKLTDDIARAAWELLGELEEGADLDALIAATAEQRASKIATRELPLTGVTEFPHLAEELPARDPYPVAPQVRRYGAQFEALRDEPASTLVFLATLGTVAQHTARATFLSNLLAAGGVAVETAGATASAADVINAYEKSGSSPVVALTGSDDLYAERGAETIDALRAAGAKHVIIAGKPRDLAVDDSAAMGVDALAFLHRTREALA
jgi:methylmalonyl-CoA mutase